MSKPRRPKQQQRDNARPTRPNVVPREHGFNRGQESWERDVFISAHEKGQFTSVEYVGVGVDNPTKREHRSFLEAFNYGPRGTRFLIYAIAPTGRWCLVPRDEWPACVSFVTTGKWTNAAKVQGRLPCRHCGKTGGVKKFGNMWAHPSCWRVASMR